MAPKKLTVGTGCEFSCKTKYVFPKRKINRLFPNLNKRDHQLQGCFLVKQGRARCSGNDYKDVYFFTHPDLGDEEYYIVRRFIKVTKEGPAAGVFVEADSSSNEAEDNNENVEVPETSGDVQEDVARFLRDGFLVDDDNLPAPENVPNDEATENVQWSEWNSATHCNRAKITGRAEQEPQLIDPPKELDLLQWFLYFMPWDYIQWTLIPSTNQLIQGSQISNGEFITYLGIWLLLSTVNAGVSRRDFWSSDPVSPFDGAPFRCNTYMSYQRFEQITQSLKYTSLPVPAFRDKLHEVRQLLFSFNSLMEKIFVSGWVVCLDESMSPWTRQWTCPAFVFCPRKPHPKGNEYHTIADGKSGILFGLEMVEGKDAPPEFETKKNFHSFGKTAGLMLRMCETLFGQLKVVVLDSGFCVLQGIIELRKRGVFAAAVIKKRRYWPKHIKGDEIKNKMEKEPVGTQGRLPGKLDGMDFDIFTSTEPDYVMMFMSTYGSTFPSRNQKKTLRYVDNDVREFYHSEVVANHYKYRDSVDAHNAKRHDCGTKDGLSIESTWKTNYWPNRVFAFILGLCEVNTYLALRYFRNYKEEQIDFRKKLAQACLHNTIDDELCGVCEKPSPEGDRLLRSETQHGKVTMPEYCDWTDGRWKKKYKTRWQQRFCKTKGCKNRTRIFCKCSMGVFRCTDCFQKHLIEAGNHN